MAEEQHPKLDYSNILRLLDTTRLKCMSHARGVGEAWAVPTILRNVQSVLNFQQQNPSSLLAANTAYTYDTDIRASSFFASLTDLTISLCLDYSSWSMQSETEQKYYVCFCGWGDAKIIHDVSWCDRKRKSWSHAVPWISLGGRRRWRKLFRGSRNDRIGATRTDSKRAASQKPPQSGMLWMRAEILVENRTERSSPAEKQERVKKAQLMY